MVVGSKVLEKWWGLHNNIRAQVLVSISARTGLKPRMQGAWKPLNLREHQHCLKPRMQGAQKPLSTSAGD
jgi:hypothetical protein